jgi:hypothetical protein
MNTKQILYNALASQLETKKIEAEKYSTEVYDKVSNELKLDVLNYFTDKVKGFNTFNFTGKSIRLELSSSWYDKVDINVVTGWNDEAKSTREIRMEWNSGNLSTNSSKGFSYLKLISDVHTKFDEIVDKYSNEWYPTYLKNEKDNNDAWKEYNDLKNALDNLKNEIKNDSTDAMKVAGFTIKKFKEKFHYDWDYVDDKRVYRVTTSEQIIKLQFGRAMHNTTWVNGFKVLGKKGNKYSVEIYRDGYPDRTYDVLEKKFESFIGEVSDWENGKADKYKEEAEQRVANNNK